MEGRITYIVLAIVVAGLVVGGVYYLRGGKTPPSPAAVRSALDTQKPAAAAPVPERAPADALSRPTRAVMRTSAGDITLELFAQDAPHTVENFAKLAREGFYDGVRFHRVIKGFMIQSGDPKSRDDDWSDDGTGGPGYVFADEINSRKLVRGTLAMANAGPDTNGSQFFIVTAPATPWLDGKHTVFGRVVAGMNAVDKIESARVDHARGDHPVENITISTVDITGQ
jgi:peptidyl-prolyl cis-trans isomerase B (cyclophilin B)